MNFTDAQQRAIDSIDTKCHLNAAEFDANWERQTAAILDDHPEVRAWAKNDRLGLLVPYRKDGAPKKYIPDFNAELQKRPDAVA